MFTGLTNVVKRQIVESVEHNRITFVFGPTGCGKSSQVPKLLLEHYDQVLCTQPRRLAAIAIATRVAEEMSCPLGEKVGFHVGNYNSSSISKTKLLFASAGMLLEYFRSQGTQVFQVFTTFLKIRSVTAFTGFA